MKYRIPVKLRQLKFLCCIVLSFSILFFGTTLSATILHLTEAEKQQAYNFKISVLLLDKIAEAESAFNPFALHLQTYHAIGKTLRKLHVPYRYYFQHKKHHYQVMPTSKLQAIQVLDAVLAQCTRYDVGKYQISHLKMKDFKLNPYDLLDANTSAYWASKILRDCYDKEGSLWKTVECYHRGSSREKLTGYTEHVYRSYVDAVYSQ